MKQGYGKTALFLTAMLWGTTFAIGKLAAEVYSATFIIALRFTVASIVLMIAAFPLRSSPFLPGWQRKWRILLRHRHPAFSA